MILCLISCICHLSRDFVEVLLTIVVQDVGVVTVWYLLSQKIKSRPQYLIQLRRRLPSLSTRINRTPSSHSTQLPYSSPRGPLHSRPLKMDKNAAWGGLDVQQDSVVVEADIVSFFRAGNWGNIYTSLNLMTFHHSDLTYSFRRPSVGGMKFSPFKIRIFANCPPQPFLFSETLIL